MVSRRKILSRSRDDLNLEQQYQQQQQEDEDDVWYQKDKLYKEHIQEVLDKWTQIDDEIWAKVIVFERNRRVAKAYARAPVLTINGSDDGFDGMRIGLSGFDNPLRDPKTDELKKHVGQGVKIKMDDAGNILIRRYAKSNVFIKSTASGPNEETAIGSDILKLPNHALESEKIVKVFDMKKFQSNVNRELRRAYPDRRRLETQCLSAVAFVKSENDILDCPIWVLIVNVVAMDMLKSKLPPVAAQIRPLDIKNRPRIPIPDEDPYSVAGNGGMSGGSSGSSGGGVSNGGGHVAMAREQILLQTQQLAQKRSEKPPKLPPRDNLYPHDIPKPDYDDILEEDTRVKVYRGKSDKGKDLNKKYDDPYYCGLRARVPNFVKNQKPTRSGKESTVVVPSGVAAKRLSVAKMQQHQSMASVQHHQNNNGHHPHSGHHHPQMLHHSASYHAIHPLYQHPQQLHAQQHMMYHAKSYESGIGMYRNHVLESFPNRYRDYLRDWQDDEQTTKLTTNNPTTTTDHKTTTTNKASVNKHQHHRTKIAAMAATRVYADLTAPQQLPPQTILSPTPHTKGHHHHHHHHHRNNNNNKPKKSHNIIVTKNPLYAKTGIYNVNQQLYSNRTPVDVTSGGALYDQLPRPRCVTCQCNCAGSDQQFAPHLMRYGSESDIASIHQRAEDFSIDSIETSRSQPYLNHLEAIYTPRLIPTRAGLRSSIAIPTSAQLPVFPFYQNHYCHQPPQMHSATGYSSANPYSTYYSPVADSGLGEDDGNGISGLSFRLRKTASNESFFGYPVDVVVPSNSIAPSIARPKKYKQKGGVNESHKRRVTNTKSAGHKERKDSVSRSLYSGSTNGFGDAADDYSDSLYGFFKPKLTKDLQPLYA